MAPHGAALLVSGSGCRQVVAVEVVGRLDHRLAQVVLEVVVEEVVGG